MINQGFSFRKVALAAVAATFAMLMAQSCGSQGDEVSRFIPEDALWVARVDAGSILTKAEALTADGSLSYPAAVTEALSWGDTFSHRIASTLPQSGLRFDSDWYLFNSGLPFAVEFLAPIADSGATERWISSLTGASQMTRGKSFRSIYDDRTLYAISGDALYVGLAQRGDEKDVTAAAEKLLGGGSGKSITDNPAAMEPLMKEADITLYASIEAIGKTLQSDMSLRMDNPVLVLLAGLGISAVSGTATIGESLDFDIEITAKEESLYKTMCANLLSDPSPEYLDIIPADMPTVVAVSVVGKKLLLIDQVNDLLNLRYSMPIISEIDFSKILATVDGPVVVGISPDPHFMGVSDYIIAFSSKNQETVLAEIARVAHRYGQSPAPNAKGERVYNYMNQRIAVGTRGDKFVYVKMLDNPYSDTSLSADEDVAALLGRSKMGLYSRVGDNAAQAEVVIGALSGTKILGKVRQLNPEGGNILTAFIALLCQMEGGDRSFVGTSDGYESDYGGFEPIDELSGF